MTMLSKIIRTSRILVYRRTLDSSTEFFRSRVSTDTGTAFIFLSMAFLGPLSRSKQIQADGTFKTVPHLFYQLFTFPLKAYEKPFPVAHVLMSEKTLSLYNLVIEDIIGAVLEVNNVQGFACEPILSDLKKLLSFLFKHHSLLRKCWLLVSLLPRANEQANNKRACREGLIAAYRSRLVINRIIQMMIAFVLLPAYLINAGVVTIQFHLQECEETARLDFIALSQAEDIRREALSTWVAERERLIILTGERFGRRFHRNLRIFSSINVIFRTCLGFAIGVTCGSSSEESTTHTQQQHT
ncbi:Uncharacterized protein APZ42_028898 [Daphnia magna]|uniref:Uncharacterized protein n=1 Tax=Daphnia magna TaxID=35525 RepID=A0A164Q262_9CRUS|nr:Uncharacterized protein APZ42_028898 [Daphnia magna]